MPGPVPSSLKALGRRSMPEAFETDGRTYRLVRVLKNDFFAITTVYEGDEGLVLVKVGRQAPFLLVPLRWVGRLLRAREVAILTHLEDVPGVPRLIARWDPTGLVREFVPGHPLAKGERVHDDFHERLRALVQDLHDRGVAVVDLEKCENVLVGDDGRPYLFDFQISWYFPKRWGGELAPARWLRRRFQSGDVYHLVKLQRRTRPDQLTPEALARSYRKPWYVVVHNTAMGPFKWLRRRILDKIDPKRGGAERGTMG